MGSAVASWLIRWSPDRMVHVRALVGNIVLCSWARHFTFIVPLSTQEYKWVPANLMLGVTLASHLGGVKILLLAKSYRNRDKLFDHLARGNFPMFLPMKLPRPHPSHWLILNSKNVYAFLLTCNVLVHDYPEAHST